MRCPPPLGRRARHPRCLLFAPSGSSAKPDADHPGTAAEGKCTGLSFENRQHCYAYHCDCRHAPLLAVTLS
eukprot:4692339-Pyramimonas_sp.AAC.1